MSVKQLKVIGSFLIFTSLIIAFLYNGFGLNKYIEATSYIDRMPESEKNKAYSMLSQTASNSFHSGTLAKVFSKNNQIISIWIWSPLGLESFKTSDRTIYSSFDICTENKWKQPSSRVHKNDNIGSSSWLSFIKVGDSVNIYLEGASSGGNTKYIKEVVGYDWWVFTQQTPFTFFEKRCQNH